MTARGLAALERKCRAADELLETIDHFETFLRELHWEYDDLRNACNHHFWACGYEPEPETDK